jgi:FAD/FMN-containing dehydrogenase
MNGADNLLNRLVVALPEGGVLTGDAAKERAVSSWTRLGTPLALIRPSTTDHVSTVLKLCNDARVPVTAWGGKTGLVNGAISDGAIALSLERMSAVEEIDPVGCTMTVQAGCVLQTAAEAAEAQALQLPLDLGARGSATLGGMISTNAGGNRVIRYGMTRNLVLGLEAVLADGTVVSSLNRLLKNNAGYDVKQLFIGSEGTLGIVTRAVLRLMPLPTSQDTAFLGVDSFDKLPEFLRHMERGLAGGLSAFEVMWKEFHDLVTTPPARGRPPLSGSHPYYVLVEAEGGNQAKDSARFEAVLMKALAAGLVSDAAIAKSQAERNAMWELRDDVAQTARNGPIFTFDISLGIAQMQDYVAEVRAALKARWGEKSSLVVVGHLGDGNLHLVVGVGARDKMTRKVVEGMVYGPLCDRGGSVSAEHGIGLEKRDYLSWCRGPEEIAVMRALKAAFDPNNILNPGKVLA